MDLKMTVEYQDPCIRCGGFLPRPSASACHEDPCPTCRYPRPLGDCSDLTREPPALTNPNSASATTPELRSSQKEVE